MLHPVCRVPGKRHFRVVVIVSDASDPNFVRAVTGEVRNVNDAYDAVEEYCRSNTSYFMNSRRYILTDYYTEEIQ